MKNKVNEWQELSLKKDVEKIRRSISEKDVIDYAFMVEALLVFWTLVADKFIDFSNIKKVYIYVIVIILFIAPFIVAGFAKIILKRIRVGNYKSYSVSDLVDSFDNDICYCVMTADSYVQMLYEAMTLVGQNDSICNFYYIEACYYINRAKYMLARMEYKVSHIFTKETDSVLSDGKILYYRLENVMDLISQVDAFLIQIETGKVEAKCNPEIKKLNQLYDDQYAVFRNTVKSYFKENDVDCK